KEGFRCPLGSHVRRSNPRDVLSTNKPESSIKISNRHRILRRGRNFGPPISQDFDIDEILHAPTNNTERGLHFICFNANIARQFEFVQHTWTDNTKFQALYSDPDPILGIKDTRDKSEFHDFTIPAKPVRRKIRGLSRFVHVMGGAYFFMPGLRALRFLSELSPTDSTDTKTP
ncbi:MAG: peroxidase, partial [Bacteroidota bacterium]